MNIQKAILVVVVKTVIVAPKDFNTTMLLSLSEAIYWSIANHNFRKVSSYLYKYVEIALLFENVLKMLEFPFNILPWCQV